MCRCSVFNNPVNTAIVQLRNLFQPVRIAENPRSTFYEPARAEPDVSSLSRVFFESNVSLSFPCRSHFAPLRVTVCWRSGSLVAMVREGWHQLRFTGCRGDESKQSMTFQTYKGRRLRRTSVLTQRFLFEVRTLQTVFGCCPGLDKQKRSATDTEASVKWLYLTEIWRVPASKGPFDLKRGKADAHSLNWSLWGVCRDG